VELDFQWQHADTIFVVVVVVVVVVKASGLALRPTQSPIQWVLEALSPEVKWLRHEVDHSSPSSAEVKNVWSYYLHSTVHLHGMVLSKTEGLYLPVRTHSYGTPKA